MEAGGNYQQLEAEVVPPSSLHYGGCVTQAQGTIWGGGYCGPPLLVSALHPGIWDQTPIWAEVFLWRAGREEGLKSSEFSFDILRWVGV